LSVYVGNLGRTFPKYQPRNVIVSPDGRLAIEVGVIRYKHGVASTFQFASKYQLPDKNERLYIAGSSNVVQQSIAGMTISPSEKTGWRVWSNRVRGETLEDCILPKTFPKESRVYSVRRDFPYAIDGREKTVRMGELTAMIKPDKEENAFWAYPLKILVIPLVIIDALIVIPLVVTISSLSFRSPAFACPAGSYPFAGYQGPECCKDGAICN
jgi:hypothetical protein